MSTPHEKWLQRRASVGAVTSGEADRLVRRVEATMEYAGSMDGASWWSRAWTSPGTLLFVAAHRRAMVGLAAILLASTLALGGSLHWSSARLDQFLESELATTLSPTPEVALLYTGSGRIQGRRKSPRIDWRVGTLQVSVQPSAGVDLVVETDEATVQVHGTRFSVTKDLLGTMVEVENGLVGVTCLNPNAASSDELFLAAGKSHRCLPNRPSTLLGRARALHSMGKATMARQAAQMGLELASPGDPVRGELLALQVEMLLMDSLTEQAAGLVKEYLDEGYEARREDMQQVAEILRQRPTGH